MRQWTHQLYNTISVWITTNEIYLELRKPVEYNYVVKGWDGKVKFWLQDDHFDIIPTGLEYTVEDDRGFFRKFNKYMFMEN